MFDSTRCEPAKYDDVRHVLAATRAVIPTERTMLVGARCRDALHDGFGCTTTLRGTTDADLALALNDWTLFEAFRNQFPSSGSSGHRFIVSGIPVDVIAFGPVEDPPGWSAHPPFTDSANVHGFRDAFARRVRLLLSDGTHVALPRPESYATLKMHAWLDRSDYGEFKDAADLGIAVHWWEQDTDELFTNHPDTLSRYDFDTTLTAAHLLGESMYASLSPVEGAYLRDRMRSMDQRLLARYLRPAQSSWESGIDHTVVAALAAGVGTDSTSPVTPRSADTAGPSTSVGSVWPPTS